MERIMAKTRLEASSADIIRFRTLKRIENIGSDPERIEARLKQLQTEWPVENILQTKAAVLTVWGTIMGMTRGRRWFALPLIASGLLFQHAVQGDSPDFRVLRRLGFRTQREIDEERTLLKGLRGDFHDINELSASDVMETVQE